MTDYTTGLGKTEANHQPLTPLQFLTRAASVYPHKTSIIYDDLVNTPITYTWSQTFERCRKLAHALRKLGIGKEDTVAIMAPNTPAMVEAAFGVPMSQGVLCTLNTRLDINALTFCLQHSEAKVLIIDSEYAHHVELIEETFPNLILIHATDMTLPDVPAFGKMSYEALLQSGEFDSDEAIRAFDGTIYPTDEWDAIALNYTSGTTGKPKGVVYHHRGATLNALSNILDWDMPKHTTYLWTLPLFHCNGWCFPWTVAERAGINVCLRQIDANLILKLIAKYQITHYCAAPIVHNMIAAGDSQLQQAINHNVKGFVAGAPPSEAMLEKMEAMNFNVTHVYGLTEVYGPVTICAEHDEWQQLSVSERAAKKSRQGVVSHLMSGFEVFKQGTTEPVAADATEMGELALKGNMVMKGYLKNPKATKEAFAGGWFRTGDLGVKYPDGYIKIMDRLKDIIISGGENISSIEIENTLYKMPEVSSCGVVAASNDKWGEVPVAFIEIAEGATLTRDQVIEHCRQHLAKFKVPKHVIFCEIPKTSTGKIQKFELRNAAQSMANEEPKVKS
ncbi:MULTISPECIES: AMP-binding protein [Psychrobacter]|uniref:AMP-binding protein n=3 Tax=Psychrobacter TaxID=497 RepID=A0A844M2Y8_9GAMM|nr:AMP-binding protein [Psychrobacter sanguinis]MUG33085.1 AMP-binding protein [Psychrobacter sanguinis]